MASATDRRLKKIKYDGKKVTVVYLIPRGSPDDEEAADRYELCTGDPPRQSLIDALHALAPDVGVAIEWPEEHMAQFALRTTVRSVSFTWRKGVMGAVITALHDLTHNNGPWLVNTPHKPELPYNDGDPEDHCLHGATVAKLETLIEQAYAYVDGDREQMKLFNAQDEGT